MPEPKRNTFLTTQPGKGIWTFLTIALNAVRLPLWLIYFIPQGLRQDARWDYKKAVRVRVVRAFLTWSSQVQVVIPWDLTPNVEKEQWQLLEPAPRKYFAGVTTLDSTIQPAKIGGTWYPAAPASSGPKPKKVVLHFHGGAFVIGDGRKKDLGFLAATLLKHTGVSHVFGVQYRLASNPGGRFPAALQDAITSYTHLLHNFKISPSDVIISGDSAGGNLCLCLLRYLADHGSSLSLPNPSCAWLWSPWVNPPDSITKRSVFHLSPNAPTDYLNKDFGAWGASCYAPDASISALSPAEDNGYINFIGHPFRSSTPLFFSGCENEVLLTDINESYDAFTKVSGNKTELSLEPAAIHDIMLVGKLTGFEAEAAASAQKAWSYYKSL